MSDKKKVQLHVVPMDSSNQLLTPDDSGRYNTGTSSTIRLRAWIVTEAVSGAPTDEQLAEMRDVGYIRWELSSDGWHTPFRTYADFPLWDHDSDTNTPTRNWPLQAGQLSPWQKVGSDDNVCLNGFWTEAPPQAYRHIPASCNLNIGNWVELTGQKSLRDAKRWRTKLSPIDFEVTLPGAFRPTTPPAATPIQFGISGWVNCSSEAWLGCATSQSGFRNTPKVTVRMGRIEATPHVVRHRSILFRNDPEAIDPETDKAYGYTDANRVDWNPGEPIPAEVTTPLVDRQYGERVCVRKDMDPTDPDYIGKSTDECNRDVRVGEPVAISYALQNSGDNTNAWYEYVDPAAGTSFFTTFDDWDEVELSAPAGAAAIVFGNLCPVTLADGDVENVFGDANAPRDRTAEALAKCRYPSSIRWSAENFDYLGTATFVFPTRTGSLPLTVTYYKEDDDPATPNEVEFMTLGTDMLTLNVVAAPADVKLKAELNQYNFENQLNLGIGYHWFTGVPAHWGVGEPLLPGGRGLFGGATYADLAEDDAVRITVPSGTLTLLGDPDGSLLAFDTPTSCTGPCTLTLSRAMLQWSARYRLTQEQASMTAIGDTAPYFPASLEYKHAAGSGDVTLSGVLKPDPATGRPAFNFSYVARRAVEDVVTKRYLLSDADGMLSPGESAPLTIGFGYTNANGQYWSVLGTDQNFYHAVAYRNEGRPAAWTRYELVKGRDEATPDQFSPDDDSYLIIRGPATWAANGGKRLHIGAGRDYDTLSCVRSDALGGDSETDGLTCYVINSDPTEALPELPVITIDPDADEDVSISASFSREAGIWVMTGRRLRWGTSTPITGWAPPGTPSRIWREFIPLSTFGTVGISVEAVNQLEAIALDRKPVNDITPTGPVPVRPGKAELMLRLFNANGASTQIGAVSSITLSANGGTLSSQYGCANRASSCIINLSTTGSGDTADNSLALKARETPDITREIPITYYAPESAGSASINATVVSENGNVFSARLDLIISGSAARVAAGGDMPRVHSSATEDDDRDVIEIPISAEDEGGNEAPLPRDAVATVKGPDGAALPSGSHTAAISCRTASGTDTRLGCKIVVTITAAASSPLASGAYTATLTGSGLAATDAAFAVAGPAERLSISIPDELPGLARTFTATAAVVDKDGAPVADGTWVQFSTTAAGGASRSPSAIVTSPALSDHDGDPDTAEVRRRRTKNGEASASITVVGNAISVLRASVGDKTANEPIDTRTAADAPGTGPAYSYNTPGGAAATDAYAVRSGSAPAISADEALGDGPAGTRAVWLWNGVEWINYGEGEDGAQLPGSFRFTILPNDVVWFGGS